MPSRRTTIIATAGLLLLIGGVSALLLARGRPADRATTTVPDRPLATDFSARFAGYEAASEPNGDLAKVVWPKYVTEAGPEVKRLYEFQIRNGQLMRYMPCFCGCGQNAGHRSNRDCYVRGVGADGSVVLDPMAPT